MTNPLAQDLGGVVRLLEKATPGPWKATHPLHRVGGIPGVKSETHKVDVAAFQYQADSDAAVAAVNFLRTHSSEIAGALEQLRDLHDSIRTVYDAVPALPITADTMDAATDALHAFCLLVGIHRVDVGDPQPQPAMQQGGGGGDHG